MAKRRRSKSRQSRRAERPRRPQQMKPLTRPTDRQAYPSPAERERIIKRRDKLLEELIPILIESASGKSLNEPLARLVQKYGQDEVMLVLNKFQETATTRELIGEDALLYRTYRRTFARFGGDRPFLNKQDYEALNFEHAKLLARRKFKSLVPFLARRSAREQELHELLLLGVDYWEDITPPSVPARPADFNSPPSATYHDPARTLLKWGWAEDEQRLVATARNKTKWQPVRPELGQMVFDEGLLAGWPGEADSWASYHALHLLGHLQAHEYAEPLLALLDRENDWLSDRLPVVWRQMGPAAEAPLWAYLADSSHTPEKRSVVLRGLSRIAEAHPKRRSKIINRMANLLDRAPADDATANGYIVHVLDRMEAVEAKEMIHEAFQQDKVDPKIMQPGDVDFLYDW